jgi:hypothetical protein
MSRAFLRQEKNIEKRVTQGREADETGRDGRTQGLSLSLSPSLSRDACNPYYEHPGAR